MGTEEKTGKEKALEAFRSHDGFLRMSQATALGIHPQTLARLVQAGALERPVRGLYVLKEAARPIEDWDLVEVTKLVPKAVFCLITALSLHELTTQIPRLVYIALPRGAWKPDLDRPPLDITWLSHKPYQEGREIRQAGQIKLSVYCAEKTVADCFKFRRKIGEDVAIEALQDYLQRGDRDLDQLIHFAEVDRVANVMEPYLKALV